jgi:hypothetical protein
VGFNPGTAAGSAATFAGILAAIVLAVLGQLAVTKRENASGHKYQISLLVGFPLLVQLLACAYTFVLLSGQQPAPGQTADEQLGVIRGAAFGFAICGSMLAVSAAGSLVFLRLVLQEAGRAGSMAATGARAAVIAGVYLDIIFLVYGYSDIHRAFYGEPFSVVLWVGHTVVIGIFVTTGLLVPPPRVPTEELESARYRRKVTVTSAGAVAIATLIPVWAFLIANKHSFTSWTSGQGTSVVWVSYLCGAWTGVLLGVLLWLASAQDAGDEQPVGSLAKRVAIGLHLPTPQESAEIDSAVRRAWRHSWPHFAVIREQGEIVRNQFEDDGLASKAHRAWLREVRVATKGYQPPRRSKESAEQTGPALPDGDGQAGERKAEDGAAP